MARRVRYSCVDVAEVNGFAIERERIGAATYWHAVKSDAEGYCLEAHRNCGSKAAAIAKAEGC
ncbi:hypothetical protein EIK56_24200 [Sphingomonas sp. C8-2]|nr:hypothetical protein EIK56_24200 [Sphingomonas sp. C8-2]